MSRAERIFEVLAECPNGLTVKALAARLNTPMGQISSPLSKLVAYGFLKRTRNGSSLVYQLLGIGLSHQRLPEFKRRADDKLHDGGVRVV